LIPPALLAIGCFGFVSGFIHGLSEIEFQMSASLSGT
jgi:hypothetical protein